MSEIEKCTMRIVNGQSAFCGECTECKKVEEAWAQYGGTVYDDNPFSSFSIGIDDDPNND